MRQVRVGTWQYRPADISFLVCVISQIRPNSRIIHSRNLASRRLIIHPWNLKGHTGNWITNGHTAMVKWPLPNTCTWSMGIPGGTRRKQKLYVTHTSLIKHTAEQIHYRCQYCLCSLAKRQLLHELLSYQSSSSRMRVLNHNWSATKQRPHPQSVAEISRHSVLSGDRTQQCETSSGSRHKDIDQCL